MPAIVEFPHVVRDAVEEFGDLFSCEPQRRHFAEYRHKIAHDYLFANYVCTSGKHYPLEFRRFKKRDQCEPNGEKFHDHTALFCHLVDWVCKRKIPGDFTFDSYFTNADNLNHIHSKQDEHGWPRGSVGDLKFNRKVEWKGTIWRAEELAGSIPPRDRKELGRGDQRQWCFTCSLHIPKVNHKVRIVIIWNHRRDKTPRKILVTNRTTWEVGRVLRTYRHRWTGTETYPRDGKQPLGVGDGQLRNGQGQTRLMDLVMLAYSLLRVQRRQGRACDWAQCRLTPIGEACRAMLNETLRATLAWVVEQVREYGKDADHVFAKLRLA